MSKKKVGKQIITDIVKSVLENREDVEMDEKFIHELVSNTMKTTPLVDILTSRNVDTLSGEHESDDDRLTRCIEVIALINTMIDHHLSGDRTN